ncbi:ribonuclease H-like domain-containing protein, partial [Crucibulum laeve]
MASSSSAALTSSTFDVFNTDLQNIALKATRNAAMLPADVAFHRSIDSSFAREVDGLSARVMNLTNKILVLVGTADQPKGRGKGKGRLDSQDDVMDNFHSLVVDSMDQLLERTDICLDDFLGRNKAPAVAINPVAPKKQKQPLPKGHLDPVIQHAAHLQKPQLSFKRKPDNSDAPWYPTLTHKYNAKVPLGHVYTDETDMDNDSVIANHPYRYEITHLTHPSPMFTPVDPIQPRSFEETPLTWINTPAGLQTMIEKLKNAKEIAVDLEHHSYRSYLGFLCLMQISDRDEDWIIDLLALRDDMAGLNEVFTDPEIVKVFHGAESDIVWLQQDFNIYIVNLFDTYHASKLLEFPRHGLANLLEMYCDYIPDKRYQLADWRIRPLPEEMLQYARSDTHFLLFIYDNLRNALLDRGQSCSHSHSLGLPSTPTTTFSSNPAHALLNQALARSAETSLRVYTKEVYDATGGSGSNGWDSLAKKWNKGALMAGGPGVGIGAMQREVYKAVHGWRESIAREEDESTRFVLPNHFLFQLAEQPPADMPALLAIFRSNIPAIVRKRGKELLEAIRGAVKQGLGSKEKNANEDVVMEEAVPKVQEEEPAVQQQPPRDGSSSVLWASSSNNAGSSTSHSSLFGSTFSPSSHNLQSPAFSTSKSALFGKTRTSGPAPVKGSSNIHAENPRFKELVARINSTLVIVPTAPRVMTTTMATTSTSTVTTTKVEVADGIDAATGMQIEIPYVPASQRQTARTAEEKDTIVVVGQARQKKRKR